MSIVINVDSRALQDENYAQKGIGQHTLYVVSVLKRIPGATIIPVADPLLGSIRRDAMPLFDTPARWVDAMAGDVYFNPSPLTHDTLPFLIANRKKMKTCAVVHDFIPLHRPDFISKPEQLAPYNYLVNTLAKYQALFPNSISTSDELSKLLRDYSGRVATVHCRSRYRRPPYQQLDGAAASQIRPATLKQLVLGSPYIFVAAADDPRKNPDIAVRAALDFCAMGLKLVIGGGLSDATRQRLLAAYPEQCLLAEPVFLPRLTDAELRQVYLDARLILVSSLDEGFSLPVAEAIALDRVVVASSIPAHDEQIKDKELLFAPKDLRGLVRAVKHALSINLSETGRLHDLYVYFNYEAEQAAVQEFIAKDKKASMPQSTSKPSLTIVGPSFDRKTGIAIYNSLMVQDLADRHLDFEYVDVDAMELTEFYEWLLRSQETSILYIMGNNNEFHSNCFVAIQNIPGCCILHDSRLFEFLLNKYGPYYILHLWQQRNRSKPISVDTVVEWQRERQLLPDSFLDPLVTRVDALLVHNEIAANHIRQMYDFSRVYYLPFALQMTDIERGFVAESRAARRRQAAEAILIAMMGETEPTKGCVEMVFALKILLIQRLNVRLRFVGKSDEPYHDELLRAINNLGLQGYVSFTRYVPRQDYLDSLASADIIVQLRYPMFGQVSGPLADAVACGVPVVTTEDLAIGTNVQKYCEVIPNRFSPLHVAEGIRHVIEGNFCSLGGQFNSMEAYNEKLFQIFSSLESNQTR